MVRIITLLLVAVILCVGCANAKSKDQLDHSAAIASYEISTLEGKLVSDFERSEFISCSGVVYWVANPGPAYALKKEADAKNRTLRVTASVSPNGEYGHMGAYQQEILISAAELGTRTQDCGNP